MCLFEGVQQCCRYTPCRLKWRVDFHFNVRGRPFLSVIVFAQASLHSRSFILTPDYRTQTIAIPKQRWDHPRSTWLRWPKRVS